MTKLFIPVITQFGYNDTTILPRDRSLSRFTRTRSDVFLAVLLKRVWS